MAQESNTDLECRLAQAQRELSEALEQPTATSEVLQVISSSPGELEPAFQAMLANATRICEAKFGMLYLCEGEGQYRVAALHGAPARLARNAARDQQHREFECNLGRGSMERRAFTGVMEHL
jgi:hypothetical protein